MAARKMAKRSKGVSDSIFQIRITLDETEPMVWRRILVPASFSLEALHSVLQLTLGWQMSHLYDFRIGGVRYADEGEFDEEPPGDPETTIGAAFADRKSFEYTYDFGDGWQHHGEVEEIMPRDERFNYPVCIGGENACPPEDCGGVGGYEELKKVIVDKKHRDHDSMIQWLGGHFDPASFDANRVNRDLLWMTKWAEGPNDQGLYHPFNW